MIHVFKEIILPMYFDIIILDERMALVGFSCYIPIAREVRQKASKSYKDISSQAKKKVGFHFLLKIPIQNINL